MTTGEFVIPRAVARPQLAKTSRLLPTTLAIFRQLVTRDSWGATEPCPPGQCDD